MTQREVRELGKVDMDLFTRCVFIVQTSRLDAASTFRKALKSQ